MLQRATRYGHWSERHVFPGYADDYDDVVIHGNVSEGKFSAFYLKRNQVVAAAAMRKGNVVALIAEKLLAGDPIFREDLNDAWYID